MLRVHFRLASLAFTLGGGGLVVSTGAHAEDVPLLSTGNSPMRLVVL